MEEIDIEHETVRVVKEKNVAVISLSRPRVHNAMNEKMMRELIDCFKSLNQDNDVKIIILTGEDGSFCAGADLNWMKKMVNYSHEENIKDSQLLLDLYETIYSSPKPTIARVNGHAFGGGIGLFAACDIVVASDSCKFAFSEVKLGIIPAVISTFVRRRMSVSTMKHLFITGERFNAEYAKEIGLVDIVTPRDRLDEQIEKQVGLLRSSGPKAIEEVKKLLDALEQTSLKNYKEYTVKKIAELRTSKEGQEGINAFLEKRKPRWSG